MLSKTKILFTALLLLTQTLTVDREFQSIFNRLPVTYGSTLRIQHKASLYYLHSHDINYGTGTGQQSVTAANFEDEFNSLWIVKEGHDLPPKKTLTPVHCGDIVRFEHAGTNKNLHINEIQSAISEKSEISAFGENGEGNEDDSFRIICEPGYDNKGVLHGGQTFTLRSNRIEKYLFAHSNYKYDQRNCGMRCPIMGQLEISADMQTSYFTKWQMHSGIVMMKDEDFDSLETVNQPDYDKDDDQFEIDL